jgi:carbamoyl-phosphate synthase large subunit
MQKIKIGITGTGSLIGQAIIKSLLASSFSKDIYLTGFDYFSNTAGSYWVKNNFILPDILKKSVRQQDWLRVLIKILKSENIKFIFIGLDFELPLFAKYKDLIESETNCKVISSDASVINTCNDKYLTYKFLKKNGFSHPATWLWQGLNKNKLSFPYIVKPRIGSRSRDVFVARNKKELFNAVAAVKSPLIQELVGDPTVEYTCGIIYLDDQLKGSIVLRRDLKNGNTENAFYAKDTPQIIYDYIHKVAEKLKPFGACNFQLRLDKAGLPKIFEINARHSGTTYIRALFGFNEVERILGYLLGIGTGKFTLKEGMVKRYYDELFIGAK